MLKGNYKNMVRKLIIDDEVYGKYGITNVMYIFTDELTSVTLTTIELFVYML